MPPPVAAGRNAGWIHDTLGPAVMMLNVRTVAQAARNRVELAQLMAVWEAEGYQVARVHFAPAGDKGPLSWHLTTAEREAVQAAWRHARAGLEMQAVRAWWEARRPAAPHSP